MSPYKNWKSSLFLVFNQMKVEKIILHKKKEFYIRIEKKKYQKTIILC